MSILFLFNNKKARIIPSFFLGIYCCGAVEQIRTADLVITNDVLCQLSYNSKVATRMRLELMTSSVTG